MADLDILLYCDSLSSDRPGASFDGAGSLDIAEDRIDYFIVLEYEWEKGECYELTWFSEVSMLTRLVDKNMIEEEMRQKASLRPEYRCRNMTLDE